MSRKSALAITGATSPLRIELGKPVATLPKPQAEVTAPDPQFARMQVTTLPLRFEPNRGQADDGSQFIAKSGAYEIHFSPTEAKLQLPLNKSQQGQAVDIGLEGVDPNAHIEPAAPLEGKSNYLRGSDRSTWLTDIPNYGQLQYRQVYPGIDLVFYGNRGRLEYDFMVSPKSDPESIALRIPSGAKAQVNADGNLQLQAEGAGITLLKPIVYQLPDKLSAQRTEVAAAYRIVNDAKGSLVKFALGDYDPNRPLIIDPVLVYSISANLVGTLEGIAVDGAGNTYIVSTYSETTVTKISSDGSTVIYNTAIGSAYYGTGVSIAVDGNGQAHVVGYATSGYPTTDSSYRPVSGGGTHVAYSVLSAAGDSLVYSTYILGSNTDYPLHVAVDNAGKAYISGITYSHDFPNTGPNSPSSYSNAFVTKMDPTKAGDASLIYSTVFPAGSSNANASSVVVDATGSAYVAINNDSMPTTPGAYSFDGINVYGGGSYVTKLDATGAVVYTAYLGYGTITDIAVDGSGSAYATGSPGYGDFPATAGAYQTIYPYGFVSKLDPTGSTLAYSTFLSGPSGGVTPESIALLPGCVSNCVAYVSGSTTASDFPVVNPIQDTAAGNSDAFIVALSGDGTTTSFSTYIGGSSADDYGQSTYAHIPELRLDNAGNEYLAGNTYSSDFPFSGSASTYIPYLVKISPANGASLIPNTYSINFGSGTIGVPIPQNVILRNYGTSTLTFGVPTLTGDFSEADSCGGSIVPGSSCTIQVTFTGTIAGYRYGTLTISHNGNDSPTQIALTGYVTDQAYITLSPSQLQFGAQGVNTSSGSQTITVTNTGSQPATLSSISLADTNDFSQINNCPSLLPKGGSCTVQLIFTPLAVGTYSSYIYVSYYGGYNGSSYVSLYGAGTGVGTSSAIVSPGSMQFDDQLLQTTSSSQTVYLTNTGSAPLTAEGATITGDFTINYNSCTANQIVYPDQQCQVNVTFTPTAAGTRSGTLTISSTAPGFPQTINLNGNGVTPVTGLAISPAVVQFNDTVLGTTSSSQSIQIINVGTGPVSIDRVYSTDPNFIFNYSGCSLVTLGLLSSCSISVEFRPTTTGPLTGSIVLVDNDPSSPQTIAVSGNGVSPTSSIYISPGSLTFDDTVAGTTNVLSVYLWNPGNTAVSVSSITADSSDFAVTYNGCSTVSASYQCQFNVTFQPQTAGPKNSTLTIVDSSAGSPHTMMLSGNALAATESLVSTPQAYTYNDQVIGTTSSLGTFVFYNSGTSPITVSGATVSSNFNIYSNGCSTIYPNSSCSVYVQFIPTAAGPLSGTLTLLDDAPGNPHTVALSGTGLTSTSTIVVNPSDVSFTDQAVGTTSSSQIVYFYNTGNSAITVNSLTTSGDFTIGSNSCTSTISPGSYCYAYVTFTPSASGPRTSALTMTDTAPGSPHGANLSGNGLTAVQALTLSPGSLDYGSLVVDGTAGSQATFLVNSGSKPVAISAVTPSTNVTASGCVTTLNPGTTCQLNVGFTATATGTQTGTVTVTSNGAGSPQTVNLAANGVSSTPSFSLVPNGLAFNQQLANVQTSGSQTVTFKNNSGAPVTVNSAVAAGDFTVTSNGCNMVANGSSCSVSVAFAPTGAGVRSGTLTFNLNPTATIVANLTGYGVTPAKVGEVSPAGIAFTDQVVGSSSSSQNVYLYSEGTQAITAAAPTISGDFTISYTSCSGQVSSYCLVQVKFQPTATGPRSGVLTFTDDSPTSPHTVSLSGNGLTSTNTLVLNASVVNYPDQAVNTSSNSQTVYLYNTGNTAVNLSAPSLSAGDFSLTYGSCGATLSPASYCYEQLTFTPSAIGTRTASLTFNSDSSSGPQTVNLSGNGVAATKTLVVSTSALQFTDEPVGISASTQYFYLYNSGTLPVNFSTPTITGTNSSDFNVNYNGCGTSVSVRSYCYIYIQFTPSGVGVRNAVLTLTDDASTSPQTVALVGHGDTVVKSARLSITNLVFPDQPTQTTGSSQYVYLYNQGNVTLNLSSVTLNGGDFAIGYSSCNAPTTIGVNSYCYIYVGFTPTATGPRTGTVTFTDDSATSPHVLNLSGKGTTPNPSIAASTSSLVFPNQELGTTSTTQYITIFSRSNVSITFSAPTVDNPDFIISSNACSSFNAPSQTCYYGITFKPSTATTETGTLSINSTATGSPLKVSLTGTGIPAGTGGQLSQTSITFANQVMSTTSPGVTVYYSNSGSSNIVISSTSISGDFSKTTGCDTTTIGVRSYCAMTVYFTPTATGMRGGSITINDNTAASPRTITLTGTGVAAFPVASITPSALQFGTQLMSVASSNQVVTVRNAGTAMLTFGGVAITPSTDFNITSNGCANGVAAGSYCQIYVEFTPSAGGLRSANLMMTDNAADSPQNVPLSGTGVASSPIASLSTSNYTFGSYGIGTPSSSYGVNLYNTGNAPLNITSIATTDPEFVPTTTCGTSLAASSNCSIGIVFTPSAVGNRTATLMVTDNATGSPHQMSLAGTGLAPSAAQVAPATLIYPNQAVSTISGSQTITVHNTGASLTVSSVTAAGDFAQTNNCTSTLGVNGSCSVSVTFNPTAVGNRNGTLTVTDNSPTSPHVITLNGTGTGAPTVKLSPGSLTFSGTNVGTTTASQPITLTNTGNGPLGIGSIAAGGDFAQTNNCAPNLNANVSCTINVTFTPTTYGNRTGSITVTDNATGSPQTVNLTGTGLAAGASVNPSSLTFTSQAVGSTSNAQGIMLSNPGTITLVITAITPTTSEYSQTNNCTNLMVAPGGNCTINVEFSPVAAGARNAALQITGNAATVTVPLSGSGTGPVASLDKPSLGFGSVAVGSSSGTQTIKLSSVGDTALAISSIAAGGDYSQTNNCGSSVAVSSFCTITVTFSPTAPGTRGGQITITDNAANSPQAVMLNGSGLGAAVNFNPPSLSFSTVLLNTASTPQSVVISNAGTTNLSFSTISATGDFSQTNNCVSPLAPSASCTANVTFTPTATGTRTGSLTVATPNGNASAGLSGTGITQGLSFTPGSLTFNPLPVNLTSTLPVTVTDVGTSPVTFASITPSGDYGQTNNCPATLQPNNGCTITVSFTPTQQGIRLGSISLMDDAPGSPQTISLTGMGTQPMADIAVTGNASPRSAPPGGSATFTVIVTNNGPSTATGVNVSMTAPTNATLQSVTPNVGQCAGTGPIACTLGNLNSGSNATITMVVTNTTAGAMTTSISATASETDPNMANNSLSLTSDTSTADVQAVAASTATVLNGQPAFSMAVMNNGPSSATNVVATFDLERFGYVNSVASQGTCAWNGVQLACALGTLANGGGATITVAVQPPDSGWTSIQEHATADQYDPAPNNNIAQITPTPDGYNTKLGTNVSVDTADPQTGTTGNLVFQTVTRPGMTIMSAAAASAPPTGYRVARGNETFNVSTSAQFNGAVTFTLHFAPAAFWHPAEARLFHNENGAWIDRTTALNPAGSIAGVIGSLSEFAIFEPPDQPPVANPGVAQVIAGTNASGNQVQLNGSLSADPENDSLTYRWTGPFPEGNGTVTGLNPMVTLPLGASQVTLVVNDGEVDSTAVAQSVTVSDFTVSANTSAISIPRGSSANLTLALSPKFAAYDRAVSLACANLPADLTCQFAQNSVTPAANGSTVTLTISAAKTASLNHSSRALAASLLAFGLPFGIVILSGDRKRRATRLALLAMLLLILYMVGCGGGGGGSSFQTPPPTNTGSTSTINVTATSSGIQHAVAVTVTRN